jgi:hypothetical protein
MSKGKALLGLAGLVAAVAAKDLLTGPTRKERYRERELKRREREEELERRRRRSSSRG